MYASVKCVRENSLVFNLSIILAISFNQIDQILDIKVINLPIS